MLVFRTTTIYHQVSTKYSMFSTTQSSWAKQSKEIHRQIPALVRITNGMGAQLTHMQAPDPDSPHTHIHLHTKSKTPNPTIPRHNFPSTLLRSAPTTKRNPPQTYIPSSSTAMPPITRSRKQNHRTTSRPKPKPKPKPTSTAPATTGADAAASSSSGADNGTGPVFFWKPHEEPYGIFSQWYQAPFTAPDSNSSRAFTYNTAEQYLHPPPSLRPHVRVLTPGA